jgi:hypothetical protein
MGKIDNLGKIPGATSTILAITNQSFQYMRLSPLLSPLLDTAASFRPNH